MFPGCFYTHASGIYAKKVSPSGNNLTHDYSTANAVIFDNDTSIYSLDLTNVWYAAPNIQFKTVIDFTLMYTTTMPHQIPEVITVNSTPASIIKPRNGVITATVNGEFHIIRYYILLDSSQDPEVYYDIDCYRNV
jgi:hypothetical protein